MNTLMQAKWRAAQIRPLRIRDGVGYVEADRITTLKDCVAGTRKAAALAGHACRHLLIPAVDDCDHYFAEPLFGRAKPLGNAQYLCDTAKGPVVLPADTLVYWN